MYTNHKRGNDLIFLKVHMVQFHAVEMVTWLEEHNVTPKQTAALGPKAWVKKFYFILNLTQYSATLTGFAPESPLAFSPSCLLPPTPSLPLLLLALLPTAVDRLASSLSSDI